MIAALMCSSLLILHTFARNVHLHFQNDVIKVMLSFSNFQSRSSRKQLQHVGVPYYDIPIVPQTMLW